MANTNRMSRRDIDSAVWYLAGVGIEVTADRDARSHRFDVTFPSVNFPVVESMSKRDVWMLARGHRIARAQAQQSS